MFKPDRAAKETLTVGCRAQWLLPLSRGLIPQAAMHGHGHVSKIFFLLPTHSVFDSSEMAYYLFSGSLESPLEMAPGRTVRL